MQVVFTVFLNFIWSQHIHTARITIYALVLLYKALLLPILDLKILNHVIITLFGITDQVIPILIQLLLYSNCVILVLLINKVLTFVIPVKLEKHIDYMLLVLLLYTKSHLMLLTLTCGFPPPIPLVLVIDITQLLLMARLNTPGYISLNKNQKPYMPSNFFLSLFLLSSMLRLNLFSPTLVENSALSQNTCQSQGQFIG